MSRAGTAKEPAWAKVQKLLSINSHGVRNPPSICFVTRGVDVTTQDTQTGIENVAQKYVPAVVSEMSRAMDRAIEKFLSTIPIEHLSQTVRHQWME